MTKDPCGDSFGHSPGPWRFQPDETFSTLGDQRVLAEGGISPAIVFGGIKECAANARLIAAAPDLWFAVKALEHYMRDVDLAWSREVDPLWADLVECVRLTVQKVEEP